MGTITSTGEPGSMPSNPRAVTPIIIAGVPLTESGWPRALRSPPNTRCQKPYVRTATAGASARSSSGTIERPMLKLTPRPRRKLPETKSPGTRCARPDTPTLIAR